MAGIESTAQIDVEAPAEQVWAALTEPAQVQKWMFGTALETDWQVGSPITWSGDMNGKAYQDKGEVLEVDEPRRLVMTHFSPLTGQDDTPANYHTLVYTLDEHEGTTTVELSQDNNSSDDEAEHSAQTWQQMLGSLKETVEAR